MSNTTIKIAKYDLEGNFLEVLEGNTYAELSTKAGVSQQSLRGNIEGLTLSCENFQFKNLNSRGVTFRKVPAVWDAKNTTKKHRIIGKYYKNKLICTYFSQEDAVKKNKITLPNLSQCLSGQYKNAGGFEWKYLN